MEKITCKHIAILMATYNGEKYLAEQIDSLLAQTCQDWHLYVHDDGSKDNTVGIIKEYTRQHPDKITLLEYPPQGGACKNFLSMMERVEAPYYMFCDQDDVWLKEKIAISVERIREMERQKPGTPIVVYADLMVTDTNLQVTNHSFWQEICLYPEFITNFNEIAASTAITGCAMLFNHKAKQATLLPASHATMHDAWIAACVLKQNGIIQPIHQQLVYYRQHEGNCIGSEDLNHIDLSYRIRNFRKMQRKNWQLYQMLRSLGYGSIVKFFYYKWIYKQRIHHQTRKQ